MATLDMGSQIVDPVTPTLVGLHPELREQIWSLVVVHDEPIRYYVESRTIARPEAERAPSCLALILQKKRHPSEPLLLSVSRHIRAESLWLYARDNVFAFRPGKNQARLMEPLCRQDCYAPEDGEMHQPWHGLRDLTLFEFWTVRLEFMIFRVDDPIPKNAYARPDGPATVDISLDNDGMKVLSFGGQFARECTCWFRH
ncbi:hypothetical protein LTS10_009204 [Elasticomyces elasticus]|nr:hypothetical protein LTS10_009204 [Elasticomyces elasticus]